MVYQGHRDQRYGCSTYSQHGEDIFILNLFQMLGYDKFSWLDLGAHMPETISNTKLFYEMGMRGVNVEPNPHLFPDFLKHRPEDLNLMYGLATNCEEYGTAILYTYDDRSPINTMRKECSDKFLEMGARQIGQIEIATISIDHLIKEYCQGKYPEFLNSDIEEMDYDVLRMSDFSDSRPIIICAEVKHDEAGKFRRMMRDKGFHAHARLWSNVIYIEESAYGRICNSMGF